MSVVFVRKNGKIFHEPWCPYVRKMNKRISIKETKAISKGYCECKFCRSTKGIAYKYRKYTPEGLECYYDKFDDAICFKSCAGFWKIIWNEQNKGWNTFHLNQSHFCKNSPAEYMMRKGFHRQTDIPSTSSISNIISYIQRHDKDLAHHGGDYHKMYHGTKQQKKFYNSAKKRAKKKSIRNVYKILNKLNKNQNGSTERSITDGRDN